MDFVDERRNVERFRQDATYAKAREMTVQFAMHGNDDDHGRTLFGQHFRERSNDANAIQPRHHQINDERVDVLPLEHFEGFDAVGGKQYVKIGQEKQISRGAANVVIVVHDENSVSSCVFVRCFLRPVVHSCLHEASRDERKGGRRQFPIARRGWAKMVLPFQNA